MKQNYEFVFSKEFSKKNEGHTSRVFYLKCGYITKEAILPHQFSHIALANQLTGTIVGCGSWEKGYNAYKCLIQRDSNYSSLCLS